MRALVQHDGMMIDCRSEINGVLFFSGESKTDDLGVIIGLRLNIGHLVGGMGDLLDAYHSRPPFIVVGDLRFVLDADFHGLVRGKAPTTSTIAATSFSPKPICMSLS